MAHAASGKYFRNGIGYNEAGRFFADNETAKQWFIERRWPNGICCPYCGSMNVNTNATHRTMPYRCRKRFAPKGS